jgi:hypothetical protein
MEAVSSSLMTKFIGIDNVSDPTRLSPVGLDNAVAFPLQEANNLLIDDSYAMASRGGFAELFSGTDIHSMWSKEKYCFYVDGDSLYQLLDDFETTVLIRAGLTQGARMSYDIMNDRVYYTNGYQIGYVLNQVNYDLMEATRVFKRSLPPGNFIAFFAAKILVARYNELYVSDPLCDYYDIRKSYRRFAKDITMLRPLDDGLYVSDDRIWWIKGRDNNDFERIEVYPQPAIRHTDMKVNGLFFGDGVGGNVALWTSADGICMGNNSGVVQNLTEKRYKFTPTGSGTAMLREKDNVRHYINTLY